MFPPASSVVKTVPFPHERLKPFAVEAEGRAQMLDVNGKGVIGKDNVFPPHGIDDAVPAQQLAGGKERGAFRYLG